MTATATSLAARGSVIGIPAATQRETIYNLVNSRGRDGATIEEIEIHTGLAGNTVRPRRKELEKMGQVKDSGKTRLTKSRHEAIVWVSSVHASASL